MIQSEAIWSKVRQYDPKWAKPIQQVTITDPKWAKLIQSEPNWSKVNQFIQFYSILCAVLLNLRLFGSSFIIVNYESLDLK